MISLGSMKIYVHREPVDMHYSFDRLGGIVRAAHQREPGDGNLYLFISKNRKAVKGLYFERDGYVIWYKRLECGSYTVPAVEKISSADLMCMLEGVEVEKKRQKLRYIRAEGA